MNKNLSIDLFDSCKKISDEGAKNLCQSLQKLTLLQSLNLDFKE